MPSHPDALLATRALHADDVAPSRSHNAPVAPALSLASTFRSPHPQSQEVKDILARGEDALDWENPSFHVYSRYTQDTRSRGEAVLSSLTRGHGISYGSGLTATHAALTFYNPKVIAIRKGYHGVHSCIEIFQSLHEDVQVIDLDAEYPKLQHSTSKTGLPKRGLLVWVETPLNPTGESRDIQHYADRAHAAGGHLIIDSTFGPPPLQDPFAQGADCVMHSLTKYFGGHSDLLAGSLTVKTAEEWKELWTHRTYLGLTPGNLESWLLLRSMRTLSVRVTKQAKTASAVSHWLQSLTSFGAYDKELADKYSTDEDKAIANGKVVDRVWHSGLQPRRADDVDKGPTPRFQEGGPNFDPSKQMSGGFSPTFAFRLVDTNKAIYLPHATHYFTPATSLGGVESLLEWRHSVDRTEDPGLIRISIGLEEPEDLIADLRAALAALDKGERMGKLGEWQAKEAGH